VVPATNSSTVLALVKPESPATTRVVATATTIVRRVKPLTELQIIIGASSNRMRKHAISTRAIFAKTDLENRSTFGSLDRP
jgi:hypothetical protein